MCSYSTFQGQTERQALKRKYDELERSNKQLRHLYQDLATGDADKVQQIVESLRAGERPESILQRQHGGPDERLTALFDRVLLHSFLVSLLQSTAPLQSVIETARSVLSRESRISLPTAPAYKPLRDRIITLEMLSGLLSTNAIESDDVPDAMSLAHQSDGSYDGPVHWVPGGMWTELTDNDDAVSHLISLFLLQVNT